MAEPLGVGKSAFAVYTTDLGAKLVMDLQTAQYYQANARSCVLRYERAEVGRLHALLRHLTQPGCRILDIGGGSGRDAAFLATVGCQVTYTDGCEDMVRAALERHPSLNEHARVAAFPLTPGDPLLSEQFDLVLCVALVMHLDDSDFRAAVAQMEHLTAAGGCAVVSYSAGRTGLLGFRDRAGRLFRERPDEDVISVFSLAGLIPECYDIQEDALRRLKLRWTTRVFRKSP